MDLLHIRIEGKGKVKIVYFAYPVKIYDNSPLSTEFEVAPQAQSAIPYFAAAQAVLSDSDMRRYYAFMDMFNNILTNVCASNESLSTIRVVRQEEL